MTSLTHEQLAILTLHRPIILMWFLLRLPSHWHRQPGSFNRAVHRRLIYRSVLFRFGGRIKIDYPYGLCFALALVGPAESGCTTDGSARPVLEYQHKLLQCRPYRGQFLYQIYTNIHHTQLAAKEV